MEEIVEAKPCLVCHKNFAIFKGDLHFYKRFQVSTPNLCFDCRLQRRMAFYNRRKLYRRTCDLTKKSIVSMFSPDKPFKVYEKDEWYSDKWDPLHYGRDFNFKKTFFSQFNEFMLDVPFLSVAVIGQIINSEYTNDSSRLKNCYLVYDCADAQDTMYAETFVSVKDSMELLSVKQCELCYECIGCQGCYGLKFSRFCKHCSESWFLRDCIACKHCFGCTNLQQKEYCIFNKPHSRNEYEKFIHEFQSTNYDEVSRMRQKAEEFFTTQPIRATRGLQNVNCEGDRLYNSKNSSWCFNSHEIEDCRYCTDLIMGAKDCIDINVWGDRMEACYNSCIVGEQASNVFCSAFVGFGCGNIAYSMFCTRNCNDLVACIGLQKKQYCILNKQYSKDDYQKMRALIVTHMKETGEWGEFFPPAISLFGYNESLAFPSFPMTKEEVQAKGWKWCDYEPSVSVTKSIPAKQIPPNLEDFTKEIQESAILCEVTEKPFKVTSKELEFYRQHKLPTPRRHPDQRHYDRLLLRGPVRLWERLCSECGELVISAHSPEATYVVLCETCYVEEVF